MGAQARYRGVHDSHGTKSQARRGRDEVGTQRCVERVRVAMSTRDEETDPGRVQPAIPDLRRDGDRDARLVHRSGPRRREFAPNQVDRHIHRGRDGLGELEPDRDLARLDPDEREPRRHGAHEAGRGYQVAHTDLVR